MSQGSLIALYKATFQPPNVLQEKRINYDINYTIFEIIVVTSDPEYHKNNNKQDIKYFLVPQKTNQYLHQTSYVQFLRIQPRCPLELFP